MKNAILAGSLLMILGTAALVWQGVTFTRQKKVMHLGPIHMTRNTQERIPLPPILGGIALVGGLALVVLGVRRKA